MAVAENGRKETPPPRQAHLKRQAAFLQLFVAQNQGFEAASTKSSRSSPVDPSGGCVN